MVGNFHLSFASRKIVAANQSMRCTFVLGAISKQIKRFLSRTLCKQQGQGLNEGVGGGGRGGGGGADGLGKKQTYRKVNTHDAKSDWK